MAERIVRVMKEALRKYMHAHVMINWSIQLHVIEFGYRITRQANTCYSTYFLMYGRGHVAHDQARAMLYEDVDVEDGASMLRLIIERTHVLQSALLP